MSLPLIVASSRLNFLAERTIAACGMRAYVVHTLKPRETASRFSAPILGHANSLSRERSAYEHIIEDVMHRRLFPGLDAEGYVFMDHDIAWESPEVFAASKCLLEKALDSGVDIAWLKSGWMTAHFSTCPMFAVRRCQETMEEGAWVPTAVWPDDDTGWNIARRLHAEGRVTAVDRLEDSPHIGNLWYNHKYGYAGEWAGDGRLAELQDRVAAMLIAGGFNPAPYEHDIMRHYPPLHGFLRTLGVGECCEFDSSLDLRWRPDDYYLHMWRLSEAVDDAMDRLVDERCAEIANAARQPAVQCPWYVLACDRLLEADGEQLRYYMRRLSMQVVEPRVTHVCRILEHVADIAKYKLRGQHNPHVYGGSPRCPETIHGKPGLALCLRRMAGRGELHIDPS